MRTLVRQRWPWAVAIVCLVLIPLTPLSREGEADSITTIGAVILLMSGIASLVVVGALLATRVAQNSIGYLLLTAGALMVASPIAALYAGADDITRLPGAGLAAVLGETLFIYGIVMTLIVVPLVFPTGRLLGPRWRWILVTVVAAMGALTVSVALGSERSLDDGLRDPTDGAGVSAVALLEAFNATTAFIAMGGAVAATAIRFRRSRGIERQQMKWLVAVAAVAAVTMPTALIVPNAVLSTGLLLVTLASVAFLPIAIGIAVLRYRLYEIDRIISRTIGWAIVTGVLVGTFALLVLGSSAVLEPLTGGNTLAVAGSTLIAAALFAPVRGRVQRAVDRRFDRSRYDGERLITAFGERLRDEVDLTTIRADVLATVDVAVRPAGVGLWLRGRAGDEG